MFTLPFKNDLLYIFHLGTTGISFPSSLSHVIVGAGLPLNPQAKFILSPSKTLIIDGGLYRIMGFTANNNMKE